LTGPTAWRRLRAQNIENASVISFAEARSNEKPLNIYGYSKFLFDQFVRRLLPTLSAPVTGLRYFNVYGPRESHKGRMAQRDQAGDCRCS